MPAFPTPHPIDLAVDITVGRLEVRASDREDTLVTVAPSNPNKEHDRRGAEQTRVEFDGSRLVIDGPRPKLAFIGPNESVDVTVEVPTDSRLTAKVGWGSVQSTGRLGATRIKASGGTADLEAVGDLWLRAGHGGVEIDAIDGSGEVTADHGDVRIGTVAGDLQVKASHGSLRITESRGSVDAKLSYGGVVITRALGSVVGKTAYGEIELTEVSSGSMELESGFGRIEVGVRAGVAAWLDASSKNGTVRNELTGDAAAEGSKDSVAVRARAAWGDVVIRRSR